MGSTLEHGIYLPSEGEKNCYQGLAGNWNKVDGALGDVAGLKQLIESKFTKEIVTELPTEDINPYCIYLILKTDPETDNIYDEWVYINNAWEYLGNTQVDMTQYYTKQEVNELPAVASGVTSTKVGNYDAHIANGDIHVTANDKAKWNTVALIKQLRLVNTQVGSATTIAFANIDDTNGIKVGDKCMDLDGKMFEITAVDATNETVTVGSALVDLALDGNVVHTSGNETVGGQKTFTNSIILQNSDTSGVSRDLSSKSQVAVLGDAVSGDNTKYRFVDKNDNEICYIRQRKLTNSNTDMSFCVNNIDNDNNSISAEINFVIDRNNDPRISPSVTDSISLGRPTFRWKNIYSNKVNGLTPSSLGLPDLSNSIDISSYITDLAGLPNVYSPPANGYIVLRSTTANVLGIVENTTGMGTYSRGSNQVLAVNLPVVKNSSISIYAICSSLTHAKFIPCQGNV